MENRTDTRNYGVDLLRIVSMLMVVSLHLITTHRVFWSEEFYYDDAADLAALSFLFCCVDCYALISGFVGYREHKYTRNTVSFVMMWLQVVFYGVLCCLVFQLAGVGDVDAEKYLNAIRPISTDQYWYFSAYFFVFLTAPFINRIVDSISNESALSVILCIFTVFSILVHFIGSSGNLLNEGYSFVWLILLYVIGALLKKNDLYKRLNKKLYLFTALAACMVMNYVSAFFGLSLYNTVKISAMAIYSYTDPYIVILSVCMLLLFANMNIGNKMKKVTAFTAPAAFGVFLIHTQSIMFDQVITSMFSWITELPVGLCLPVNILCTVCIFTVCVMIEKLRIKLFELIRLKKAVGYVYSALHGLYEKLIYKLSNALYKKGNV